MVKTIAFDFDGVIHRYRGGWGDGSIYDSPDMKIVRTINSLLNMDNVSVIIISTRDPKQIKEWIDTNQLFSCDIIPDDVRFWDDADVVGITNRKLPAYLYVDDRAFKYNSDSLEFLTTDMVMVRILQAASIDHSIVI